MTETEEKDLLALGAELSETMNSRWEPVAIGRAFARLAPGELAFTMQGWIELSRAQSPLLDGKLPEIYDELAAAFAAFGLRIEDSPPEEAALIATAMRRAIQTGLAAVLPMTPAKETDGDAADGFGTWLPILTCLVTQCGIAPTIALDLRVEQAFMFLSAHRRNQGWRVAGIPYAHRDIADVEPTGELD